MKKSLVNGLQDNVDGALRSYFVKEMPDPWPDSQVPVSARSAVPRNSWFQHHARLVVAASVAVILVSYLALASMFPAETGPGLTLDRNQTIGNRPGLKHRVPTPRGGEALLWEETIPGERPTIIINVQEIKGPQQR